MGEAMSHYRVYASLLTAIVGAALALPACSDGAPEPEKRVVVLSDANLKVESPAFAEGERIPAKYTCEGDDVSPALSWTGVPEGTKEFALTADDPDAPGKTWVHWVLYGLPPGATELPEGVPATESLSDGARNGKNDFSKVGYGGPCPPPGHGVHRYFFKLYALDSAVDLGPGATKNKLIEAIEGHALAKSELTGTYEREVASRGVRRSGLPA